MSHNDWTRVNFDEAGLGTKGKTGKKNTVGKCMLNNMHQTQLSTSISDQALYPAAFFGGAKRG